MKRLLTIFIVFLLLISGCASKEAIERKAYNDLNKDLIAKGYPSGMYGTKWFMTSKEVKDLFNDFQQSKNDLLSIEREIGGRPVIVNYFFTNDLLMLIVVSFADHYTSLEEFSSNFYMVQDNLSATYGKLNDPVMNKIIPPVNNAWTDQIVLDSTTKMGRVNLQHILSIKDNFLGEQILMYISKG